MLSIITKLKGQIKSLYSDIEVLANDFNTLKGQMEKLHSTMHLIRSIDPLFHKYKHINEALKTEDTICNTMRLEETGIKDMGQMAEDYYHELFKMDDKMTYLRR